ncbi:MAG: hypothetical protein M1429_04440 [Patescibacteria group bacterium]|nr:hypothetical protein [Patescibacteria group bacterium]
MIKASTLKRLYDVRKLSMAEVAVKLGKSRHEVVYWMDKHKIPRRSWSEATYTKRNPKGDPFKIKKDLTLEEAELKGLGLGIFWGEGAKTNRYGIRVGNTDHRLILKFIEFLTKIYGVKKEKLRYGLIIFNDSDPDKALHFWCSKLEIKPEQFGKLIVIPPQGKGTYKKKSKYGVVTVGCYNTKLRKWLDKELSFHS